MIYLDYSATTPMSEQSLTTYVETARIAFANANSNHTAGIEAQTILSRCRATFARKIGRSADEIFFTGSGSEANFLTITSLALANEKKGKHLLTTKTEHPSVLETFDHLESIGYEVTYIPVDHAGFLCLSSLKKAIRPTTTLASFAHASSEIGTIQPITDISAILRKHDIIFHSDCVQTLGKIPLPLHEVDAASFSAHKLYAPKGIGAAYIANRHHWLPFYTRANHENGFRPGTVDVPAIAAFTSAIDHALTVQETCMDKLSHLRDHIITTLTTSSAFTLVGAKKTRLPMHLAFLVEGWSGQQFMLECDRHGIQIAIGPACRVGQTEPSEALKAIGISRTDSDRYIRITLGEPTTEIEIETMLHTFEKLITERGHIWKTKNYMEKTDAQL
ncbi:IscS subfamily cysteine desulfurase [Bacillus sp. FSL W7-1360]